MLSRNLWSGLTAILCIILMSLPSLGEETKYPMNITDSAGRDGKHYDAHPEDNFS